ncbi:hypothetical protein I4U23_005988 [Adineta vaga]|nr:hypothetical protein I4U23_005988 [Adineta vaga]
MVKRISIIGLDFVRISTTSLERQVAHFMHLKLFKETLLNMKDSDELKQRATYREAVQIFAGKDETTTVVLMTLIIDPSIDGNVPYGNISVFGHFGEAETEYLFSIGSVFRIVSLKNIEYG